MPGGAAQVMAALAEERRALPFGVGPAHLVHEEDPQPVLPLRLAAGQREIAWLCRLENGMHRHGPIAADGAARIALDLPAGLPLGYHRLDLEAGGTGASLTLIVTPSSCHLPAGL